MVDLDERLKRLWSYLSQIDDDDGVNGSLWQVDSGLKEELVLGDPDAP